MIGWLADVPGAALAAAGLALGVAAVARPESADPWLAALLLVAGGVVRAVAQWLATDSGLKAGLARKAAERARHWPALLSAPRAASLSGDDLGRAIDSIEMLEGLEARYDDNFFCLEPEKPFRVRVTPAARLKLDQFRQVIRIGSLRDTWQEKRTLMQMMAVPKK